MIERKELEVKEYDAPVFGGGISALDAEIGRGWTAVAYFDRPDFPGSVFFALERERPDYAPHPTTEPY